MASFDIVNKIDFQLLDNAINIARKEILNRYDFNGSESSIEFDKKLKVITVLSENNMRMEAIIDAIRNRMIKQKLNPLCLNEEKGQSASGMMIKKEVKIREGIDREVAKKINKDIKDSKLKVKSQMMDDQIRVTGKKLDDLQGVIALVRGGTYEVPLQFINMK